MNILLTGATGLIGTSLTEYLRLKGHRIIPLVRRERPSGPEASWNIDKQLIHIPDTLQIDAAIHLAGAPLARFPWTLKYRQQILQSREAGTQLLANTLSKLKHRPDTLISASAIGIYGDRDDTRLDETARAGTGFLADVCSRWEAGAQPAYAAGMRVIFLRSGLVLSKDGGLLRTILPFFRWGLGAVLGSGQQIQSWIDIHDQIRAIEFILGNREISGAVNLTSPEPVTNREFSKLLGQTLRRPVMFRAPAGILRTFGGLMIREMVLSSARVEPLVLKNAGFDFHYPRLKDSFDRLFTPERSKA